MPLTLREITTGMRRSDDELIRPCDIRGILHSHSRWTDGAHSLASMVETARDIGLEYLGISDHFKTDIRQDGLDLSAEQVQREEIERLRREFRDFDILHGVELDANHDGTLPLDDETLAWFDFVIVSFPKNGGYDPERLTEQIVALARHPQVTILGDPLGDFMLQGSGQGLDMRRILGAAAAGRTAVEVNANPSCSELDWSNCLLAQELGVFMAISPNAHRAARLVDYRHGAELARVAGVWCASILNTLTAVELRRYLANGEGS
jgi:DNA polymerase (family 10)